MVCIASLAGSNYILFNNCVLLPEAGMGRGDHLGEFEQIVMLAVARIEGAGYGAAIHEEILRATSRDVSIPAVYVTLARLERKGFVRAAAALPGPDRGGRPRKVFSLTDAGVQALRTARLEQARLWAGLDFDPVPTGEA